MKVQENTFRTVMGGFHKQEVADYISALSARYEEEQDALQVQLKRRDEELTDYKAIVEAQYAKIVELTEAGQGLQKRLTAAETELQPLREAAQSAETILAAAEKEAAKRRAEADARIQETEEKEKKALEYAKQEAVKIIGGAKEKAQQLTAAAETQAQSIIAAAKEKETATIRRTQARLSVIPSPDERTKREGEELLANAAKEAQQLRAAAQEEAAQLRQRYEAALREVEEQRRQIAALLTSLQSGLDGLNPVHAPTEPVKEQTRVRPQPSARTAPMRQPISSKERENKAEAIRRLFGNRNRENEVGNAKD